MQRDQAPEIPQRPKMRPVEPKLVHYQGGDYIHLSDPLRMASESVLIPQQLLPLLTMCDGTRDIAGLQTAFLLRTGARLNDHAMRDIMLQLDAAFLLENGAYQAAVRQRLQDYRQADHRPASLADQVYPSDPDALASTFAEYVGKAPKTNHADAVPGDLVGMLCPHIDFARGHKTYAVLWERAKPSLVDTELVIILGTDHSGGPGMITPTRQSYATPYGLLPTDTAIVEGLADVLGHERAYQDEIHHVSEHSIELVSVWLHHYLGRSCPVVPVLCGSFHHYMVGAGYPDEAQHIADALDYLREVTRDRKTLVIAAGDLTHMGPAFGDPLPMDPIARAKVAADDTASLEDFCSGDAEAFLDRSRKEADSRRICGLSPIYLTLKLVGDGVTGESMGYDQCPADADGGSLVSIAGALLYRS